MADPAPPRVVVRSALHSARRRWFVALLAFGVLAIAYAVFELGRYAAGFSQLDSLRRERALRAEIRARDASMHELRRAAADLETLRKAQTIERSELARTIGELQAQVARQSQELTFYKGIVTQEAAAPEIKIQEFSVARSPVAERRYVVRVTLVQSGRPDNVVAGNVTIVLEGRRGSEPLKLDLATLTVGRSRELPFSFRYFEHLTPEIELPADVVPERLNLEVRSSKRGIAPVSQTFLWTVETI